MDVEQQGVANFFGLPISAQREWLETLPPDGPRLLPAILDGYVAILLQFGAGTADSELLYKVVNLLCSQPVAVARHSLELALQRLETPGELPHRIKIHARLTAQMLRGKLTSFRAPS
jgi:hypothetical protein